jgi:putative CocE/NonD family hydrolase
MRAALVLLFVLSALSATAAAQPAAKPPEKPPDLLAVDMKWGVKIPMRDGVRLNATVFLPANRKGPLPIVFTLTPYIADNYQDRASYFATHGYAFALVDARGRGNSEGRFDPFFQEPRDGHDIVEWLARQPYSNGKVAMWGGSYAGFNQWLTARERPPHLASIVPVASPHVTVDFPFAQNIFYLYDIQWLTFTSGVTDNGKLFNEGAFWRAKFIELYRNHRPFRELDDLVGNDSTAFETWIAHPSPDAYWQRAALTPEQYRALALPILTLTGAYDGDQLGALHYYRQHMRFGSPRARANHFLIIGPWDHPGTRTPQLEFGGLTFGPASLVDLNGLHKEWYDWTMKGGPRPAFLKKRVAYYVIGADEWRYASSLDVIGK